MATTSNRFAGICGRHGFPAAQIEVVWEKLVEKYGEPHRHHHTLEHVDRMLVDFDATGSKDDSIELAIWFHDIIYEPGKSDNEARSAELFTQLMGECDDDLKSTVSRLHSPLFGSNIILEPFLFHSHSRLR